MEEIYTLGDVVLGAVTGVIVTTLLVATCIKVIYLIEGRKK